MITVSINNNVKEIASKSNLLQCLEQLNLYQEGIAVAINNQIITKDNWKATSLKNKDTILIIKATQGG